MSFLSCSGHLSLVKDFTLLRISSSAESETCYLCLIFDVTASISGLLLTCWSLDLQSWSGAWNKFPLAVWTIPGSKGQIGQLEGLGQAVGRTLGLCVLWI